MFFFFSSIASRSTAFHLPLRLLSYFNLCFCVFAGSSFVVSMGSFLDVSNWLNPAKLTLYYQTNSSTQWVQDFCGQRTTDPCEQICDQDTGQWTHTLHCFPPLWDVYIWIIDTVPSSSFTPVQHLLHTTSESHQCLSAVLVNICSVVVSLFAHTVHQDQTGQCCRLPLMFILVAVNYCVYSGPR